MSTEEQRRLCVRTNISSDEVVQVVAPLGATVEFTATKKGFRGEKGKSVCFFTIDAHKQEAIVSAIGDSEWYVSSMDQLVFQVTDFGRFEGAESLRVRQCTPLIEDGKVIYAFHDDEERNMIYRVFDEFFRQKEWTHFVCFPIAPVFPGLRAGLANQFRAWGIRQKHLPSLDSFHLTLILFVLDHDGDIERLDAVVKDAIGSVHWPEDRMLTFPGLGIFGTEEKTTILYAKPEGPFKTALEQFVAELSSRAMTAGFTRMCLGTPLHGTLLRPYMTTTEAGVRDFDSRPFLANFHPDFLPPISGSQLRLVQRKKTDSDKFFHTVVTYNV